MIRQLQSKLLEGLVWQYYEWRFTSKYGTGVDVVTEDWDNLVILDACRFDDFERENTIDGMLESRVSKGAHSKQFINQNFVGRELHDTVYVTGNPFVKELNNNEFFFVDSTPLQRMDPTEEGYVRPTDVTAAALEAMDRFPNKRLIIHYMQPHDPPIGERGRYLREKYGIGGWNPEGGGGGEKRLRPAMEEQIVPVDEAREAYRENIRIVLDEVKSLLRRINGRSVITSDHGEMFGERPGWLLGKQFGHPLGPRNEVLSIVPWLVVSPNSTRRDVRADSTITSDSVDEADVEEQLRALGYR